jgi:hypothetical protein
MNEKSSEPEQKLKTSKLATASIICLGVCFGLSCLGLPFVLFFVPIILGIAALIHIGLSKGRLSGRWFAVSGITVSILMALFLHGVSNKHYLLHRTVCQSNIKVVGEGLRTYAANNEDSLPPATSWCDLLITEGCIDYAYKSYDRIFHCPKLDFEPGESSYALNENIVGIKLSEIPKDVVLLFETDFGRTESGRDTPKKSRDYFWTVYDPNKRRDVSKGDDLVYRDRWNQVGGPELLTTEHHMKYKGCNVTFADGTVKFVKKKHLDRLRWEP